MLQKDADTDNLFDRNIEPYTADKRKDTFSTNSLTVTKLTENTLPQLNLLLKIDEESTI